MAEDEGATKKDKTTYINIPEAVGVDARKYHGCVHCCRCHRR